MMEELFDLQREVDGIIKEKIGEGEFCFTLSKRKIAFFVELCELANEIGFFKYWKTSHVKNDKRVKDEWADCLAFLNSIVITQSYEKEIEYYVTNYVNESYYGVSYHFDYLKNNKLYDLTDIESAYYNLYKMGYSLGYSKEELHEAYRIKCKENIRRGKEGY